MRKAAFGLLLASTTIALVGCGGGGNGTSGGGGGSSSAQKMTVKLGAQNGSGETGTATLTAMGSGKTKVVVALSNAPSQAQPAHIHKGSCAKLNPVPEYALQNVMNGHSESVVGVSLASLKKGTFAINVHKSQKDLKTYVACGNLSSGGGSSSSGSGSGGY